MHTESQYSFSNYLRIRFNHHEFMHKFISILYVIIQTITISRLTSDEYGINYQKTLVGLAIAVVIGVVMYVLRYQLDYAIYKLFFAKTQNRRFIYTHSTLIGPLTVYLIVYGLGIVGITILGVLSRPGKDYQNFKNDVLILNHNFGELNMLLSEVLANPQMDNYQEIIDYIKYQINMYNLYEIALFDNQAQLISYEQLVADIGQQSPNLMISSK